MKKFKDLYLEVAEEETTGNWAQGKKLFQLLCQVVFRAVF